MILQRQESVKIVLVLIVYNVKILKILFVQNVIILQIFFFQWLRKLLKLVNVFIVQQMSHNVVFNVSQVKVKIYVAFVITMTFIIYLLQV
jgi:hypothetical protein